MNPIRLVDVERFRGAVIRRFGLAFDDSKIAFLNEVLARRIDARRIILPLYLAGLESEPFTDELRALARELTVPETYFFRNQEQFTALAEVVLPERVAARPPPDRLRILSAGCASGEEAYSLAISSPSATKFEMIRFPRFVAPDGGRMPGWMRPRGAAHEPVDLEHAGSGPGESSRHPWQDRRRCG